MKIELKKKEILKRLFKIKKRFFAKDSLVKKVYENHNKQKKKK